MEHLLANLAGAVRREVLNGREYLVAPMTMLVPGVLDGSDGPLYYPPDEVGQAPADWNNMPIVVRHPTDNAGKPISARQPSVLEESGIGTVFNAVFNGKLQAEGWFDVDRTRAADARLPAAQRILPRLQQGKPIELSTGLYAAKEPNHSGATHNGRPYAATARGYRPDHLAVLPDEVGACSNKDGCGVLVNGADRAGLWQRIGQALGFLGGDGANLLGNDLAMGPGGAGKQPVPQNSPDTHAGLSKADFAYTPDDVPSHWKLRIDDAAHVAGAIAALGPGGFRGQKVDIPAAARAEVKARVRKAWLKFHPDKTAKDVPPPIANSEESMALNAEQRGALVNKITANCECWKGEDGANVLNTLTDDRLTLLATDADRHAANTAVANAARQGFDVAGARVAFDPAKGAFVANSTPPVAPPVQGKDLQALLPPELHSRFTDGAAVVNALKEHVTGQDQKKADLVARLTANLQGDQKVQMTAYLAGKELKDLEVLALLAAPQAPQTPAAPVGNTGLPGFLPGMGVPLFAGFPAPTAPTPPTGNAGNGEELELLATPVINWAEKG